MKQLWARGQRSLMHVLTWRWVCCHTFNSSHCVHTRALPPVQTVSLSPCTHCYVALICSCKRVVKTGIVLMSLCHCSWLLTGQVTAVRPVLCMSSSASTRTHLSCARCATRVEETRIHPYIYIYTGHKTHTSASLHTAPPPASYRGRRGGRQLFWQGCRSCRIRIRSKQSFPLSKNRIQIQIYFFTRNCYV